MKEIDEYINNLRNDPDFIRLLELKEIINTKYKNEIIAFKTAEAKYLEAKEYGNYFKGLDEVRNNLSNKKAILYSKEEVSEYKKLESLLQKKINSDINELKESISNKFTLTKIINL